MTRLSIALRARDDAALGTYLKQYERRVATMPPGTCPIAVQLALLQTAAAQCCGKCVPCRDGIPRLIKLLEPVLACDYSLPETALSQIRELAQMVCDTSDCAIGYEAARALLQSLDDFASEYESHLQQHQCQAGLGQTVPCETMCPAHVDVPAYIALAAAGDYAAAVNMVRKDNPFPTACAYVCEHPCEERCRRTLLDAPINIRGIKRFAVDATPADRVPTAPVSADTGRSIAVIGAGPSGLTCACFLARMGHRVTMFEAHKQAGGMLRYGIPAYRLPRERLDEDIRGILSTGNITLRCNEAIDAERFQEISESYDAVYVAIGAQAGRSLGVEGSDASGVMSAVSLLGRIGDDEYPDFSGKRVLVVGGGNVAMDCARTAVRAGAAEVSVVYRRRKEDMTALPAEVEAAMAEGVEMIVLRAPISVECDDEDQVCALLVQPQLVGKVEWGRPTPVAADTSPERLEADVILVAVGQAILTQDFEACGMKVTRGRFEADEHLHACEMDHVFVGGDCQTGPATAIRAIAAGKVAARNIDEYLGYHHKLVCDIAVPDPSSNDRTPQGRIELPERRARDRARDYEEVEGSMSHEELVRECGRCLRCDVFGVGATEGGRLLYE